MTRTTFCARAAVGTRTPDADALRASRTQSSDSDNVEQPAAPANIYEFAAGIQVAGGWNNVARGRQARRALPPLLGLLSEHVQASKPRALPLECKQKIRVLSKMLR